MKNILFTGFLYLCSVGHALAETVAHEAAGHAEDAGHHSSGGLPQLDPSTFASQTFWLLIVFTISYVFFSKKTLPEISKTVEGRNDRIQNDLDSAEKLRKEVEAVHTNYENSLAGARTEAAKSYADVEKNIQEQTQKKQEELRERTEREVKKLEDKIAASVKHVMNDMEKIAAEIAIEATAKIINVQVDTKDALDVVSSLGSPAKKTSKAA